MIRIGFLLFLLLASCATTPPRKPTPEELYSAAVSAATPRGLFNSRDCMEVERLFTEIRKNYPYNQRALDLESLLADCYFAEGEYAQAAAHWKILVDYYPRHEKAPEYLYHLVQAYMGMAGDYDLDLRYAHSAWAYADQFLRTYPTHPYAEKVFELRNAARSLIAQRELYVARFYLRHDAWLSAYERLSFLAEDFFDLPEGKKARVLLNDLTEHRPIPAELEPPSRSSSAPTSPRAARTPGEEP